jgi:hypothetical protein
MLITLAGLVKGPALLGLALVAIVVLSPVVHVWYLLWGFVPLTGRRLRPGPLPGPRRSWSCSPRRTTPRPASVGSDVRRYHFGRTVWPRHYRVAVVYVTVGDALGLAVAVTRSAHIGCVSGDRFA